MKTREPKIPGLGITKSKLNTKINTRLKLLGLKGEPYQYATPESILASIGEKPQEGEFKQFVLKIKTGEPPYSENFYWGTQIKRGVFKKLAKEYNKSESTLQHIFYRMSEDEIRSEKNKEFRDKRKDKEYRIPFYKEHVLLGISRRALRFKIRRVLQQLGLTGDPDDYATAKTILDVVGKRPDDTPYREAELCVKYGKPPYAENFYWSTRTKDGIINSVLEHSLCRYNYVAKQLHSMNENEIEKHIKHGMRCTRVLYDHEKHIGRIFGTLEVISVSCRENNGVTVYFYSVKCAKCGLVFTRYASKFLRGKITFCPNCSYRFSKKLKNSAVAGSNKYGRYSPKFCMVENPDVFARQNMAKYLSEFTVYQTLPGFMENLAELHLCGKTEDCL